MSDISSQAVTIRLLGKPEVVKSNDISPLEFREQVSQLPEAVGYIQTQIAYWPIGTPIGPFGDPVPDECVARGELAGYGNFSIDFIPCFKCSLGPECFARTTKLNPQSVLLVHKRRTRKPRTESGEVKPSRRRGTRYDPNPFRPSDEVSQRYYNAFRAILGLVSSDEYRRKRKVQWFSIDEVSLCCDDESTGPEYFHALGQYVSEVMDLPDGLDYDNLILAHWRTVFEDSEWDRGLKFSPSEVRKMERGIRSGIHVKPDEGNDTGG